MAQWVFIRPRDVWMFRDSKPFSAGQSFVARSMFPPTPQTVQGVIRSHFLETNRVDLAAYAQRRVERRILEMIGGPAAGLAPADIGSLTIRGPFVARMEGKSVVRYYRAPLDLLYNKPSEKFSVLRPAAREPDFASWVPFDGWRPLDGGSEGFGEAEGWLTQPQFDTYLKGQVSSLGQLTASDTLFRYEDRPGLSVSHRTRTNVESLYYRARFVRPEEGVGLLVQVSPDLFEQPAGPIAIGGESRFGQYEVVNFVETPSKPLGRLRVVLLTPAYFTGGTFPSESNWSPWVGSGRLISYVTGKAQHISGWDVARKQPKPLRHYIPAGSVFFFEGAQWQGIPFSETPANEPDFGAIGFGQVALASW